MVSFDRLRTRFAEDTQFGAGGAAPRLAAALEQIGWRSVGDPSADDVASHLVSLVEACVHDHHDADLLEHAIAALLRDVGPSLDGGMPPVDAYLPAAEEVLRRYIDPAPPVRHGGVWSS